MDLLPALFVFGIGISLVLVGAEFLVYAAKHIATQLKLSPLFISLTIVSIGTSLPELAVSTSSILQGDDGLAIANIIGSNITNSTLILGIAILLSSIRIGTQKTQKNAFILLILTFVFSALRLSSIAPTHQGSLLLGIAVMVILFQYFSALHGRLHEDKKMLSILKKFSKKELLPFWVYVIILFASVVALWFGSSLVVRSTEQLAILLKITTTVLGLTITALATSLPELITTLVSESKHEDKMVVGNIIGSNIYNLALIGGFLALFPHTRILEPKDFIFLIASAMFTAFVIRQWKGRYISRFAGIFGLLLFVAYLINIATSL